MLRAGAAISTQLLPVGLLDGPAADHQALGQFPLAHPLRPLYPDVLSLLLGQAGSSARETSLGSRLSVPCRTSCWLDPERSVWMNRPGWGGVTNARL